MNYFIGSIVFLASLGAMLLFLRKKVSLIFSEVEERRDFGPKEIVEPFIDRFKQSQLFQRHTPEKVLHRTLSHARILALKMENKTAFWLEKLRVKAQKKNGVSKQEEKKLPGDYWERLKRKKK